MKAVPEIGWAALKNGELLGRAEREFDVFVTVDQNLSFQQTLSRYSIAVIVVRARSSRIADLQSLVPQFLKVLPTAKLGVATFVEV